MSHKAPHKKCDRRRKVGSKKRRAIRKRKREKK